MTRLTLLTAEDCHLCDHAKRVLAELELEYAEIDADSELGRRLVMTAPPMRPVLYDSDGRVLAYGRLSARRLGKQLARAEVLS